MRIYSILFFLFIGQVVLGQVDSYQLIARNSGKDTLWDGTEIRTMGFAQSITQNVFIPGPMLTFTEGDSIEIDLWNISQGAPHTIHLHGLDVNQQNDGVGHLSFYVHHMAHGFYRFKAPHAGAYLYHCHVVSPVHVQGGMYGMIVIKPNTPEQLTWKDGHEYHRDYNWIMSEVDTNWHKKSIIEHAYDTMGHFKMTLLPYVPQYFLINGKSETELNETPSIFKAKVNEVVYLRLANIGNYGNTFVFPSSLNARIISSDGRPLKTEEIRDTLEIYPGERYGVLLKSTALLIDTIQVLFSNLNTRVISSKQKIPVQIAGFLGENVTEGNQNEISVFPNPASDEIYIKSFNNLISVEFRDMNGRMINSQNLNSKSASIDIGQMNSGIYIMILRSQNGEIKHEKLVITR